eukprot:TRINITY_DN4572_c0_g2_i3.p1 TRINITY_DN4572_c0_g2~~TRINITY_DN4572_c0_g2_i3.p1  ORF type:complete len:386 (-),score=106.46 TRINITY_DN4572_c0_g2_i3:93-1250(-)
MNRALLAGALFALVSFAAALLPGDDCPDAILLSQIQGDGSYGIAFNTSGMSDSPDTTCVTPNNPIRRDVWYKVPNVPTGVSVLVSTCGGATFDTMLGVYYCCGCAPVACNDDSPLCNGFQSRIVFTANQSSFYVRLGGWNTANGAGILNVTVGFQPPSPPPPPPPTPPPPPSNIPGDECSNAIVLSNITGVGLWELTFNNSGFTNSDPRVSCVSQPVRNDTWWTIPALRFNYTVEISTCGSTTADTILAAYRDSCSGPEIACNDDTPGCGTRSVITFTSTGTPLFFRLGYYTNFLVSGRFTVEVKPITDPVPGDECDNAIAVSGPGVNETILVQFNTSGSTRTIGVPACNINIGSDLFYFVTFGSSLVAGQTIVVSTCGGASALS